MGAFFWKWVGLNPPKPTRRPATVREGNVEPILFVLALMKYIYVLILFQGQLAKLDEVGET